MKRFNIPATRLRAALGGEKNLFGMVSASSQTITWPQQHAHLPVEAGAAQQHLRGGLTSEHPLLLHEAPPFLLPEERVLFPTRHHTPVRFEAATQHLFVRQRAQA